ncbi:MAG: FIST N-terminal domain-containing protein [Pirellulales bacterium]
MSRGAAPRCGCGGSTQPEIGAAVREAVTQAVTQAGGMPADGRPFDLAIVFVTAAHGPAIRPVFESLTELVPATAVIGTTAESVLAGDREYERCPAVAVWLGSLPGAWIRTVSLEYLQTPDGGMFAGWPDEVGSEWPANASLLLLADPFSFPVDAFIERMMEEHPGVPIIGGMASGGATPGSNTLVTGSRTYDTGAVGVLVGGVIRVRPVVSQGCRPIGRPLVITKADSNLIVELGGRPALERLRELYGELDNADRLLVRSSLHVGRAASEYRDSFRRGDFLVRNVVGANPESGVIEVGDLVRTGQTVQFHVRDAASADDDLRGLLSAQVSAAQPAGAIVFTCNGRGLRLFDEPHHDASCVRDCLGPIATAGFFAQGEIGPIGDQTFLHGYTASIAVIEPAG